MTYQQPQGPFAPPPEGPPGMPGPPPKKRRLGLKITLGVLGAFVAIGVIASVSQGDGNDSKKSGKESSAVSGKPAAKPKEKAEKPRADKPEANRPKKENAKKEKAKPAAQPGSQAARFKAFIAKSGTPQQKAAAAHIINVQGADTHSDIMDDAEVHTDYTGGMMGSHAGDGKLLASAFADWRTSVNGLVTVYDADGEILSNGTF
ncbi:hypothetical protein OHB04_29740 [Streptomyces sp. NBC_01775]|uniref:hypothetical protein n=1 Tax=Streptomyces sp. NBC_01775 TaxID=2975939 RepID=UPI002DD92ABA|nr:hypothetical protein [Streptomyces sp. NBC_01775]WSB79494.1 hypothetical protein OHB04_29740 [Streptomyces sp. NBC_01775]